MRAASKQLLYHVPDLKRVEDYALSNNLKRGIWDSAGGGGSGVLWGLGGHFPANRGGLADRPNGGGFGRERASRLGVGGGGVRGGLMALSGWTQGWGGGHD